MDFFDRRKNGFFTQEFASENSLLLDYILKSLDDLEEWIIANYSTINSLKDDQKMLDLLTIYIGETFRKYLGGKWFMDLEDKDNAYYHMPVLTSPDYKGEI